MVILTPDKILEFCGKYQETFLNDENWRVEVYTSIYKNSQDFKKMNREQQYTIVKNLFYSIHKRYLYLNDSQDIFKELREELPMFFKTYLNKYLGFVRHMYEPSQALAITIQILRNEHKELFEKEGVNHLVEQLEKNIIKINKFLLSKDIEI